MLFGTLNLAMKHPDVFSACLAIAPGLIAEGDLDSGLPYQLSRLEKRHLSQQGHRHRRGPGTELICGQKQAPHFCQRYFKTCAGTCLCNSRSICRRPSGRPYVPHPPIPPSGTGSRSGKPV